MIGSSACKKDMVFPIHMWLECQRVQNMDQAWKVKRNSLWHTLQSHASYLIHYNLLHEGFKHLNLDTQVASHNTSNKSRDWISNFTKFLGRVKKFPSFPWYEALTLHVVLPKVTNNMLFPSYVSKFLAPKGLEIKCTFTYYGGVRKNTKHVMLRHKEFHTA